MSSCAAQTAWAAGVYEGEGTIFTHAMSGKLQCRIVIYSTDLDVVQRCHAIMRLGRITGPNRPGKLGKKPMYRLNVNGWDNCERVISTFWYWLGQRRREQALDCFARRGERA